MFLQNGFARMNKLSWDDLALVLAIARAGSLSEAGRQLRTTHSTVYRKLLSLEAALETRLFERLPTGYTPTAAGEAVRQAAERVEHEVHMLQRRIAGEDVRLEGALRVTTTDTIASGLLGPILADFRKGYPGITVDLIVDNRSLSLTRRDADIAIRPTREPPEVLSGRRIAKIASAVYGTKECVKRLGSLPIADATWVLPDESLVDLPATTWGRRTINPRNVAIQANSLLTVQRLARAGIGLAPLPCFLGDTDSRLIRATDPIPDLASELWLLTHPDLRRNARVRAFLTEIGRALLGARGLLEGSDQSETRAEHATGNK